MSKNYVECFENKHNNGNFTIGKTYNISKSIITCDFVKLELPNDFILKDEFEFALCKFKLIKCKF